VSNHARNNQQKQILDLLRSKTPGWVPLPEILALRVAQYSARILELRRSGHTIENKTERKDGCRHSWFRLVEKPATTPKMFTETRYMGDE
jgi:hypothetical protein